MPSVVIEVGRTYVDRKGRAHTIDRHTPAEAYVEDAKGLSWKAGGISWQHPDLDLVGLAVEDARNHTSQPEPIPHADLIRAVLDGKTVQWRSPETFQDQWEDMPSPKGCIVALLTAHNRSFRIKPEPVVRWIPIFNNIITGVSVYIGSATKRENLQTGGGTRCATKEEAVAALCKHDQDVLRNGGKVLRLELDPDTLDVISARTEAP
jgi:hypothetical protein